MKWIDRVPMLSINPDAANWDDVARLAAELMECRCALIKIGQAIEKTTTDTVWVDGWHGAGEAVHITAADVIAECTPSE